MGSALDKRVLGKHAGKQRPRERATSISRHRFLSIRGPQVLFPMNLLIGDEAAVK